MNHLKAKHGEACADAFKAPETALDCSALYNKMMAYAIQQHGEQKYDKGTPYIVHCIGVSNIASRFGYSVDDLALGYKVHIACIGHDLLEDTNSKYRDLVLHYGPEIAEAIYALTDEKGRDRHEKNMKTWPGIRNNTLALIVKPCDRIFNLETSIHNRSTQLRRYVNEHVDMRQTLCVPETTSLWEYLDELYVRACAVLDTYDSQRIIPSHRSASTKI